MLKTQVETIAGTPGIAASSGQSPHHTWQAPTSGWGHFIGYIAGITFTSRKAFRLASLSALGFLGALSFLGKVPLPGMHFFDGFAAFTGCFGLIGLAYLIEFLARQGIGGVPSTGQRQTNEAEWNNPKNWSFGFYFSKRDSRVIVPKRIRWLGWTINLGRWQGAALLLALLVAIPLILALALQEARHRAGPAEIVATTIKAEVGRRFQEVGATYGDLQVAVDINRDSATPFRVDYRGLRNFKGADGSTPDPDGSFVMEYIGAGKWQGELAGTKFTVPVGKTDNIDLPFVDDPQIPGYWETVDYVENPSDFKPGRQQWSKPLLYTGLTFQPAGKMNEPWSTWTKGFVIRHDDRTASRYEIRELEGRPYLFLEKKNGDATLRGRKPWYYVLRRKELKSGQFPAATNGLPSSLVDWKG